MFYLFHGDDQHSISETLADLQAKLGDPSMLELNTSHFDGRTLSLSELLHACDSIPFLGDKRLIIVSDLLSQAPSFMDELLAYLPRLPETTRLVFVENRLFPANHPFVKLAERDEQGFVKAFNRPEGGELEKWLRRQVKKAGGSIAPQAAHLLALNAGNDLVLLNNEVEKLVLYKGREMIQPEDVTLLCPYVAEASIFDLVDSLGSRHARSAGQLLQKKLAEGTDPFYLFAMIIRQFRLLIQVKELAEDGHKAPDVARELKIHAFVAGKLVQQSHNFSLAQLRQIYAHLLEMDVGVKTGRTDMVTALSLFVAGVTA